jgi:hypothetical protein
MPQSSNPERNPVGPDLNRLETATSDLSSTGSFANPHPGQNVQASPQEAINSPAVSLPIVQDEGRQDHLLAPLPEASQLAMTFPTIEPLPTEAPLISREHNFDWSHERHFHWLDEGALGESGGIASITNGLSDWHFL